MFQKITLMTSLINLQIVGIYSCSEISHNGWRCFSLSPGWGQRERGAQKGRQRYTAIQTLLFYPSIIGKMSTVSSALKLDIDPSISSTTSSLPSLLSLSSCGTACIPFRWSHIFHLAPLSQVHFFLACFLSFSSLFRPFRIRVKV